jgi:2-polyprenyl-3-methyl-5-hydroxy-6-metoxy-1,4-benzoquinol methylase
LALEKSPQIFDYPGWEKLKNWTAQETNCEWPDINILLNTVKIQKINSPMTIVHGDLHSQNILIDEDHDCFPIDFYWCHDNSSPLLDLVMLECSLKFLVIPHRADLRSLMKIDLILFDTAYPQVVIEQVPYRQEILKAIACISEIRKIALDFFKINFDDYRLALWMMTYVHNNNPSLNRPYLLSSLQIISSKIMPVLENRPISVENYPGPYDYIYAGKENHIIWGKTHGKLLKKVKLNENIKVLDVGCGDGLNSLYLEQRGCDVTGVDISELALKGLRNRFESNNTLIRGNYIHSDISDLQFENQFDVIVSYGLYHCLPIATRIETHTKITNHLKIDGHILFCSLIEGIPLPPNHSNERITLASEEEINALFPTRQWVRESFENDIINDKHLPLVPDHQHQVTWIVARKIA